MKSKISKLSVIIFFYNYGRNAIDFSNLQKELRYYEEENITITDMFVCTVAKYKDKPAILYEDEVWTFQDIENYSNAVANYFRNEDYTCGDTVAMILENSPEYVALWLGMAKIGVHAALINTNLRGDALLHCVNVSDAKAVVYGKQFTANIISLGMV